MIVDAARRLIAERGSQFTTQELVKEAGVALQTFYRLFAGKDQLLLAVFEDLIAESCARLRGSGPRSSPIPSTRLHFYVTEALQTLGHDGGGNVAPRFVTAEHWRLYQLFPEEMARATQPVHRPRGEPARARRADGSLAPADPQRDAWFVTKLVMAVFHHYAFADAASDVACGRRSALDVLPYRTGLEKSHRRRHREPDRRDPRVHRRPAQPGLADGRARRRGSRGCGSRR